MDGIIIVNKPTNITSREVVNKLNYLLKTKKIGHTGTLDPLATGVLVCCVGKYTKLVNLITAYTKEYVAEIKLGLKTDTLDITGNILATQNYSLTSEDIIKCFQTFPRSYEQTVPIYSAVKINGKRLYEYARQKENIVLPKRKVTIYSLEFISFKNGILKFKTKVSKGTYIRSLIQDLCNNLKVLGTMASLIRTEQGNFSLDQAVTLEDIAKHNYSLLKAEDFLTYPILELTPEELFKVQNGAQLLNQNNYPDKVLFNYKNITF